MRTTLLAKALLAVVFATVSFAATANPIVCDPDATLAPPEGKSGLRGVIERLLGGSEKPQAFSGAVMEDPETGCSLGLDTHPFAAEQSERRSSREAIN